VWDFIFGKRRNFILRNIIMKYGSMNLLIEKRRYEIDEYYI